MSALLVAAGLTIVAEAAVPLSAQAAQDPTVCAAPVALGNGGFEQPVITGTNGQLTQASVPSWKTTDASGRIEIWKSGFMNVPAAEGNQFAELNARNAGTLYQDVPTTPGQTLEWSLKHRGRQGTDTMRVMIGPPAGPLVQSGSELSDPQTAWGSHSGDYVVPAGQTTTRFGFQAVRSVGPDLSYGNLLDDITFVNGPCLVTTKSVQNLSRATGPAEYGDLLRYTVSTTNGGGSPAEQVIATDVLDPGMTFVPGSLAITAAPGAGGVTDAAGDDQGEYDGASRTARVRLGTGANGTAGGTIPVGGVSTFTFDTRINIDGTAKVMPNEATVAFFDPVVELDRTSTSQTVDVSVNPAADLEITKTLDTSPLVAGEPITYTLTARNSGPQTATEVRVTDTLPPGITGVTVTASAGTCDVAATISCALPDLPVDRSATITVTGTLATDLDPGVSLSNTASVQGKETDPDPDDNTSTATGTITTRADVAIEKRLVTAAPVAGEEVEYQLVVANAGPSDARDVVITDPLDPATTLVSATVDGADCAVAGHVLSCPVGTLKPQGTATAAITVKLSADADAAVQNTAAVTSSTSDDTPDDNTSSVGFTPDVFADLSIIKSATVDEISAGESFDYVLEVANGGPSDAVNAQLQDTLPAGLVIQTIAAPDGAVCDDVDHAVSCNWSRLAVGATATVTVTVLAAADAPAGIVTNTASVVSPAEDPTPENNSSSVDVAIVQNADLRIVKTATPTTGVPGGPQAYRIEVTNNGPSMARGVTAHDALPAELTDGASATDGCAVTDDVIDCALGDLAPGASRTIEVTGTWAATAMGAVRNTATVTSGTPDPTPGDNESSVDVPLVPLADVSVTKTASASEIVRGGALTYTVLVTNDGPSAATGVVVDERPETGLALLSATATAGTWDQAARQWHVGTLLPGQSEKLTIAATADEDGQASNAVTAASQTPDGVPDNDSASVDVTITPPAPTPPSPATQERKDLAATGGAGGVSTGSGWALSLLAMGVLSLLAARMRERRRADFTSRRSL